MQLTKLSQYCIFNLNPQRTRRDLGGPPLQGSEMGGPIFWQKRPTCPESPKLGKKTPLYSVDETLTELYI